MDAIDEVRRRLGELASMENELQAARCSRDHWRKRAEESESELNALAVDMAARWVKLPADTSGETIRPGDMLVDSDGVTFRANELVLRYSGWMLRYMGEDVSPVDTIHAEERRTVEDVLYEVSCRAYANEDERCDVLLESAKEIRELLGVDDGEE